MEKGIAILQMSQHMTMLYNPKTESNAPAIACLNCSQANDMIIYHINAAANFQTNLLVISSELL